MMSYLNSSKNTKYLMQYRIRVTKPEKVPPGEWLPRDLDVVVQMLHILLNKPTAQRSGCLNKLKLPVHSNSNIYNQCCGARLFFYGLRLHFLLPAPAPVPALAPAQIQISFSIF